MPPAPLEADIERHLVRKVKAAGGKVFKVQFISTRGAPDRLILLNNQASFVELKRNPKWNADPLQERIGFTMQECGLNWTVLGSVAQVDEHLKTVHCAGKKRSKKVSAPRRRISTRESQKRVMARHGSRQNHNDPDRPSRPKSKKRIRSGAAL